MTHDQYLTLADYFSQSYPDFTRFLRSGALETDPERVRAAWNDLAESARLLNRYAAANDLDEHWAFEELFPCEQLFSGQWEMPKVHIDDGAFERELREAL